MELDDDFDNIFGDDDIFGDENETHTMTIPTLSEGSILKIQKGSKNEKDLVLQVLKFTWLPTKLRYRLELSDGKLFIPSVILDQSSSHLIKENHLEEFAIVKIDRYAVQIFLREFMLMNYFT